MNQLWLSLSQQTLDTLLQRALEKNPLPSPISVQIVNESGIEVVSNIELRSIRIKSLTLTEPDIISLNDIHIEFEKLDIHIVMDLPKEHHEIKLIDLPGKRFDVGFSWDFFEDSPDITLSLTLAEILHPTFSVRLRSLIDQRNILISVADLQIQDFNLPGDLGERIENALVEEVKEKIRTQVDSRWFEVVLERLGGAVSLIPIGNFSSWIIQQLTENEQFNEQLENLVRCCIADQVVYSVPETFIVGTAPNTVILELSNETPLELGIVQGQLVIYININEP